MTEIQWWRVRNNKGNHVNIILDNTGNEHKNNRIEQQGRERQADIDALCNGKRTSHVRRQKSNPGRAQ